MTLVAVLLTKRVQREEAELFSGHFFHPFLLLWHFFPAFLSLFFFS